MSDQYGPPPAFQPPQPPQVPFRKRKPKTFWSLVVVAGLFVIGGISNAVNPPKDTGGSVAVQAADPSSSSSASSTTTTTTTTTTTPAAPATSTAAAKPKPPPATTHAAPAPTTHTPTVKPPTESQQQALGAAQNYLSFKAFSRLGLIEQLSSSAGDGYPKADAIWAVAHLEGVNWNEQAVKAGRDYLDFTHFSRSGLIEQLSSSAGDKFTRSQAIYAVNKLGL